MASPLDFELHEEAESVERNEAMAELLETSAAESPIEALDAPETKPPRPGATARPAGEAISSRDLLDTYFRHMGNDPWLSRDDEVALAKRIEAGQHAILGRFCQVPILVEQIRKWGDELRQGSLRLRDLVDLTVRDEAPFPGEKAGGEAGGEAGQPPACGSGGQEAAAVDSPAEVQGFRLVEREERLAPGVLARIERMCALAAEASGLRREHAAALARGEHPGKDDRARLDDLFARLGAELAGINIHPDRVAALIGILEAEQRKCQQIERELRELRGRRNGQLGDVHRNAHAAELESKLSAVEERIGVSAAALRTILADIRHARRDVSRAREELVRSHLRLVVAIAKKYRRRCSLDFLDLIQEGNLGLMRAVEKFDHRHGVKLSTYAAWWVRQSIERAIMNQGHTIRIPVHMVETAARVRREHRRLYQEHGRHPGVEKVAVRAGVSTGDVDWILSLGQEPSSLDVPVGEDGDASLGDLIAAPDAIDPHAVAEASALKAHVAEALASLTPREQSILRMRFGIDGSEERTLAEVGKVFGVTRERIRQIEAKALAKLRQPSRARKLKTFAED